MSFRRSRHWRRVLAATAVGVGVGCVVGLSVGALRGCSGGGWGSGDLYEAGSGETQDSGAPASSDRPLSPEEEARARISEVCRLTMSKVDCACFWDKTETLFTAETMSPLFEALTERDKWGPLITRARLRSIVGEEGERRISGALFTCYKR